MFQRTPSQTVRPSTARLRALAVAAVAAARTTCTR